MPGPGPGLLPPKNAPSARRRGVIVPTAESARERAGVPRGDMVGLSGAASPAPVSTPSTLPLASAPAAEAQMKTENS